VEGGFLRTSPRNGVLWEVGPGYVARMMATGAIFWHHV
jgi:hypothetical protein